MPHKMDEYEVEFHRVLGDNIRKFRESKKLEAGDLAYSLGLDDSQVYKLERGQSPCLSAYRLWKICKFLGVEMSELSPKFRRDNEKAY